MANILLPGVDYSCWRLSAAKLRPSHIATVCSYPPSSWFPILVFLLPSSLLPFRTETVADVGFVWYARVTACWCQVSCSWKLSWPSLWWWPNGSMTEDCRGLVNLEGTFLLLQCLWLNFVDVCQCNSRPQFICPNRLIVCVLHRELGSQWRNQGKSLSCCCGVRQQKTKSSEVLGISWAPSLIRNIGWPNGSLWRDPRSLLWNGDIWESSESWNPYHLHIRSKCRGSVMTGCLMNEKGDCGWVVVVGEGQQWCCGEVGGVWSCRVRPDSHSMRSLTSHHPRSRRRSRLMQPRCHETWFQTNKAKKVTPCCVEVVS